MRLLRSDVGNNYGVIRLNYLDVACDVEQNEKSIVNQFQHAVAAKLTNKGDFVTRTIEKINADHPEECFKDAGDKNCNDLLLDGKITEISKGSRAARYFTAKVAGRAVCKVHTRLIEEGKEIETFDIIGKGGGSTKSLKSNLFGSESEGCVLRASQKVGHKQGEEIIDYLEE